MDKYAKLITTLKNAVAHQQAVPILSAEVIKITGESCTVLIDELELTEVRLKATINESEHKILITPKIGSIVLIGSLSGDLKDLVVLKVDEIAKIEYEQDGLKLSVDAADKKVSIQNEQVSFFGLMQDLSALLKEFKVFTPAGPSGGPLPDTLLKLTEFETHLQQLFK